MKGFFGWLLRQRILGRDGKTTSREGEGERGEGNKESELTKFPLQALLHKSLTTKQQQQQKKNNISKQHGKKAKLGEVERIITNVC